MADISIPEGDNPVRYQASLGGNQKYRNMGNVSGQAYLVRGQVTNVYYQKGTLEFNTYGSSISSGATDGSGSAPIPVDFWGKNTDGKVFGCYRPVQKGSQILVAYIGGDTSRPIVIGVYPDNEASYELISPVHYNTGDDSTDDVQNDALGERKIYPNQQMMYESGKGDILRSMGGKSFLYISENGSGYLDDINYAYDEIRDFYDDDANEIEPTMTKAQSWLLVHEDNDSDEASDGHRTRFYVNRSGELMVTFANKDDPNNIVVLEASKDSGFKLTKRFDNSNIKEDSEDYVQFGIGNGNNVSIKSVDSGDATSFYLDNGNIKFDTPKEGSITFNGLSVDGLLGKVSDAQSAASGAAAAALAASQAGEDAKSAAVNAQAAGEDAKTQAKDTRDRIIYYSSISNEKDVAIPGKYIIINTDTYIANGTIKTAHIGDAAITKAKIDDLAVGTAQIEDGAITRAKIGYLAVGTAEIEDAAITNAKVGDLSADKLTSGTIDFSVITGTNINASSITTGKLDTDRLNVGELSAVSTNLGKITTGSLEGVDIVAKTFSTPNASFTTDENGNVVAHSITITGGNITGTTISGPTIKGGNITGTNVNSDVDNLNDPHLMSVIEKQTAVSQFASLTSQFNVIIQNAKDDGIDTTAVTTAYNNLNQFMTNILADPNNASDIDRVTYKKYQDAYNEELAKIQNTFQNNANNKFTSAANATNQAASAASQAFSAAQSARNSINNLIPYTHIAYANSADGKTDFSVSDSNRTYIGMYVDFTATDSNDSTKYDWSLIKGHDGEQGIPGKAGADGKTPYFHIAYADNANGTTGFSTIDSLNKPYIGQYTDYVQVNATDPTSYAWTLIKGDTGADGISPINLVVESSNGYQFKNNIINTTFTAKLYQDNKEIDKDGTQYAYVWSKVNSDGTVDTDWNLAHQTSQKSITITNRDIWQRATFNCAAEQLN